MAAEEPAYNFTAAVYKICYLPNYNFFCNLAG